ncbi:MAG: hypothetical protein ACRC2T_13735 [Thermoguttaceae bacterium]
MNRFYLRMISALFLAATVLPLCVAQEANAIPPANSEEPFGIFFTNGNSGDGYTGNEFYPGESIFFMSYLLNTRFINDDRFDIKLTYSLYNGDKVLDYSEKPINFSGVAIKDEPLFLLSEVPIPRDAPSGNYTLYVNICDASEKFDKTQAVTKQIVIHDNQDFGISHFYLKGDVSDDGEYIHSNMFTVGEPTKLSFTVHGLPPNRDVDDPNTEIILTMYPECGKVPPIDLGNICEFSFKYDDKNDVYNGTLEIEMSQSGRYMVFVSIRDIPTGKTAAKLSKFCVHPPIEVQEDVDGYDMKMTLDDERPSNTPEIIFLSGMFMEISQSISYAGSTQFYYLKMPAEYAKIEKFTLTHRYSLCNNKGETLVTRSSKCKHIGSANQDKPFYISSSFYIPENIEPGEYTLCEDVTLVSGEDEEHRVVQVKPSKKITIKDKSDFGIRNTQILKIKDKASNSLGTVNKNRSFFTRNKSNIFFAGETLLLNVVLRCNTPQNEDGTPEFHFSALLFDMNSAGPLKRTQLTLDKKTILKSDPNGDINALMFFSVHQPSIYAVLIQIEDVITNERTAHVVPMYVFPTITVPNEKELLDDYINGQQEKSDETQ